MLITPTRCWSSLRVDNDTVRLCSVVQRISPRSGNRLLRANYETREQRLPGPVKRNRMQRARFRCPPRHAAADV